MSRRSDSVAQCALQVSAEFSKPVLMQRHTRCHRMPPALEQETIGNSLAHNAAKISAGDRTA